MKKKIPRPGGTIKIDLARHSRLGRVFEPDSKAHYALIEWGFRSVAAQGAFKWVASTITVSLAALAAARAAKILSNTPIRLQRTNRL